MPRRIANFREKRSRSRPTSLHAIEAALADFCSYERINYLMLMMVDPHVHFHVIPRYSEARQWDGIAFPDAGWPGPPQLDTAVQARQAAATNAGVGDCRRFR